MKPHRVMKHRSTWSEPPRKVPCNTATDAPLLGNGDLGVCIGGPPEEQGYCSIVPATINEMLCTAHQRVLRVFKVWPRETDASFRDLRVPGAFLVSGALRDGEIAPLDIRSEQGQPCTVENPWPTSQVQVWRDGQAAEKVMGERFDLLTRPGEQLRLAPCTAL